jgi:peptidyl-prolyl cis-trans isomerase D
MLQALRDKSSGWITIVILGFLAFLLVLSGLQGYVVSATDTSVAKVGDAEISGADFSTRFEAMRANFAQSGQDLSGFDTPERRREVLETLVGEKLMEQAASNANIVFSTQAIRAAIARDPMFQKDGKFDNGTFVNILAANNLSEAEYAARLGESFRQNVLRSSVGSTALVSEKDIDGFLKLRDQTRDFRFITLDVNDLPAPTAPSEADIKAHYEANKAKYMSTEFADFEYIRVQSSNLPKILATKADLRKQYEAQSTRFKTPERRQAAHILIEVDGGVNAPADKQKQALATANALAERARKGEDFASLARANSKDLGSANQGGDLGFLEKGTSEPAFESKLFSMVAGEISEPVLTSQGYHVIKIGEIEPERVKTFDEARVDLENEFNAQQADAAFNKVSGALVDAAIADPRSLGRAAKDSGVNTQRTGFISALGQAEAGAVGGDIANNPMLLKAAFAPAVLERGMNSDLVTLGPGDALIVRLAQRKKSELKPLDIVRPAVVLALNGERQAQALKDKAASLLKALQGGKTLDVLASDLKKTVESAAAAGRNAANRDPVLNSEAFKAARPQTGKTVQLSAVLSPDRVALIELTAVKDADPKLADKATRDSVRQQLSYEIADAEIAGLKASLRGASEVALHEDRLNQ